MLGSPDKKHHMDRHPESTQAMPSMTKRPIQAEDLYQIQTLTECEISPDGQWVVFCVGRIDPKTEEKYSNL